MYITGDVEFVSLNGSELVLRLTGNFWHNRQMVFDEVYIYIYIHRERHFLSDALMHTGDKLNRKVLLN
jgi:hypothetical protein